MVIAKAPSIMPFTVSVLPEVAAKPLAAVIVMPRLASRLAAPMACNVPPLKVISLAVVELGTAPKLRSVLIDKIPAEIVVIPVNVLVPESVTVFDPTLAKPAPLITPLIAIVPLEPPTDESVAKLIVPA